jgi:hypothetical protein
MAQGNDLHLCIILQGTPLAVRLEAVRKRRRQEGVKINLQHLWTSPTSADV